MTELKLQQESFSIDQEGAIQTLRPERFSFTDIKATLVFSGLNLEVLNYSAFGIAILTEKPLKDFQSPNFIKAKFKIENLDAQELEIKPLYEEQFPNNQRKIAFEVIHTPIDIEFIHGVIEGLNLSTVFNGNLDAADEIRPAFRSLVFEVQDFLSGVKYALNEVEESNKGLPSHLRDSKEKGICAASVELLKKNLGAYCVKLEDCSVGLEKDEKLMLKHLDFLQRKLSSLVHDSPFSHRSYFKPAGYAGDYEMMNLIYRDSYEGNSLFAKSMHKYYIDQSAAQAVKNRSRYLLEKIRKLILETPGKDVRIASIACGPAYEIQLLLKDFPATDKTVFITLYDQDVNALQEAQSRTRELCLRNKITNVNIQFKNVAVKNIIQSDLLPQKSYDLMYSAGLFDYLSRRVAIACMSQLKKSLKPTGRLIVGNFNVVNATRGIMEMILDWKLIHRSEKDMNDLAAEVFSQVEVESEPEKINLFVVCER